MLTTAIRIDSVTDDIDLVIHGQAIDFTCSTWTSSHEFHSKVPGGPMLKWKNHDFLKGGDMKCTDQAGQVVARFEASRWKKVQKVSLDD